MMDHIYQVAYEMECFLCQKHENRSRYFGELIAEKGGLFLTHFPFIEEEKATKGHLIIEPQRHITQLTDLSDAEAAALGILARDASNAIKSLLKAEHVYMFRINDKVAHLHFHLVPRYPGTPKEFWGLRIMQWPDRETIQLPQIQELSRQLKAYFSR